MSENTFEVPLDEGDGHLPYQGRHVAATAPAEEVWYWTSGWQAAEADIREGRTRAFETLDDLLSEMGTVRGEDVL
jgi:hypothetical protein